MIACGGAELVASTGMAAGLACSTGAAGLDMTEGGGNDVSGLGTPVASTGWGCRLVLTVFAGEREIASLTRESLILPPCGGRGSGVALVDTLAGAVTMGAALSPEPEVVVAGAGACASCRRD